MAQPSHRAYTVIKRKSDDNQDADDFWLNVGVAFEHEDHTGFNILLQAMPLDGKLVLRKYKPEDDKKEDTKSSNDRGSRGSHKR